MIIRVLVIVTLVVTTATEAVAPANPARQPRRVDAAAGQTVASISIPIRIVSDRIFLQAVSGTRVLWFLLDTGAPQSEMNLATADSLGVRRVGGAEVGGGGPGTVAGAQLSGAEVHLQEDPTVRVSPTIGFPMARLGQADGMSLSGILGQDFVRQRVLE